MTDLRSPRIAVSAMFLLNGALFGVWASRVPAFVERFDLSSERLGWLLLCLAGGAILSFPLAGKFSDRFGAATLTRWLAVGYAVALVLLALAPTLPLLALSLALFGAGHGAMDVAMNAWGAEVERHLKRSVMSSFHAMFSVGAGGGAASGYAAIRLGIGVEAHFVLMAAGLAGITLALASRPWASARSQRRGGLFALPRGPLVAVGLLAGACSIGEGAMADWSAVFLDAVTGATKAEAALGYAAFSVTMVLCRFFGGPVVLRLGPAGTARACGAAALLGVALLLGSGSLGPALAGFACLGIGYSMIMPLAFSRAAEEHGVGAGRAIASVATLGYGGMLLGPPMIGLAAEATSLRGAFVLLALLAGAMILLAGALNRR